LGDGWDHDLIAVACRAVIVRGQGPRTAETGQSALVELKARLAPGHVPGVVTTEAHSRSVAALLTVFGERHTPEQVPGPGAPKKPGLVPAPAVVYAQVDKQRTATGRIETSAPRLLCGTPEQWQERRETASASAHGNTAFLERAKGCDRHRNPRTARKVLSCSKQGAEHRAVSGLVMGLGSFCWVPRTLRQTPARILGKAARALTGGEVLQLRPRGFRPPPGPDIRAGHTLVHAPDIPPGRLAQWPNKRLVQRSLPHLGVNARGLG
jgi:hypothetical protein